MLRALLLTALLVAPALADVKIEQLLVRMKAGDVNIRVTVYNPGGSTQAGPILIDLYVREDASSPWQKIKTWNNIQKLPAGHRVSRDFFVENNAKLRALAADEVFEAKAVVRLPGGVKDVEAVQAYERE
jgi:hypothetical protein